MNIRAWLTFATFSMCCAANAQHIDPPADIAFRPYYMKDGLPDEVVTSVLQDEKGFLWLGTSSGIARFDGYNFTVFQNDPYTANSLGNNRVNALLKDKKQKLWIGHDEGLDLFDPETEKFPFHWYDSILQKKGLNTLVTGIKQRRDEKLWIFTNRGLYIADTETLSIKKQLQLPPDLTYNDIVETREGSIWAATDEKLIHVDPSGQITSYQHDPSNVKSLSFNSVKRLYVDSQGRLWVGTQKGLNLFDPVDKSFKRYLTLYHINAFLEHPDGTLWLGSDWGLIDFNPATGESQKLANIFSFTFSIIKDKQGVVWVASLQGFHQFYPKFKKFNTYRNIDKNIGYLVEDEKNQIWMSTMSGLFEFDHRFRVVHRHRKTRYPSMITSIDSDQGSIWFASNGKVERFHIEEKTYDSIIIPELNQPMALLVDSKGTIWLGSAGRIGKYDPVSKAYEKQESFPKTASNHFLEDSSQNIWMATNAGLVRYNLNNEKLDVFKNDPNDRQSLSNNIVYHVLLDYEGTLWVGTDGGLNKIIPGTENGVPRFQHWRSSGSGLPNDNVYTVLDGKDGSLWMSCGNLISHFFPKQNQFRNYIYEDDSSDKPLHVSPGGDFKQGSFSGRGLISSIGQIYFGTNRGLIVFHPDSLEENKFIPPVVITSFSIHNQLVPVTGSRSDTLTTTTVLSQTIPYTREITLNYRQNALGFEFAALNFVKPEHNSYKYKLEPLETEWIEAPANNRFARYTNVSPGKYTLRVIGSNNDGVWNEEGTSLVIIIKHPWWETWWAYALYAFAFISALLLWRRYDIKSVKLKNRAEHLSELDNLKTRFFANISHEFRTPITLILGPLKEMYQGKFKGDQTSTMGIMLRNGQRLLGLINQLLDLSKIEAGKLKLHTSPTDMVEFLREIASSYESLAAEKKIKYFFYPEVEILIAYIDAEKMEKVVHNLLSNAFKFTKSSGEIILYLKVDNNQAQIIVKDTGIGIPADQLNKVFDRFYQVDSSQTRAYEGSGLGMALAKELVELHKGKISVSSTEGKGTTFTVVIPLGKEHLNKDEISDSEYHSEVERLSEIIESAGIEQGANEPISSALQPVLLIVEDNADMRRYIRKTLTDHYQVVEAENGKVGVKLAEETVPDLIISDIMMPEMDGYKLCEIIKTNELTSHIPVILLTAKADRESKLAGLEFGADDYLSKPFDADELKLIVRNRIEERRKMRERFSKEITLEPKQISITSLDEKFLTKVLTIIEEHMDDENFSIEELSREAGFSNMHFYRKIKGLSGQTPSQFLRTIRLKRAAELLAKNSDNVTQIAYSVGFSSLSYFNKCFKEQFGVTPGQHAGGSIRSRT